MKLLLLILYASIDVSEARPMGGMGYPRPANDSITINRSYPSLTIPNIHACSIVDITDCCQWVWGPHWQEVLAKLFVGSAMTTYVKSFRRKRGEVPVQEAYLMDYYTDASKFRVPMEADYTIEIPYNGYGQRPALEFTCACTLHPNSIWLFVASEAQHYKYARETQKYRTFCEDGEKPTKSNRPSLREYGRMDPDTGRSAYRTTSGFCKRSKKDGKRPVDPSDADKKGSKAMSVKEMVENKQRSEQHSANTGNESESAEPGSEERHKLKKRKISNASHIIVTSGSAKCVSVPTQLMIASSDEVDPEGTAFLTKEPTGVLPVIAATATRAALKGLLDLEASSKFYDPEDWNKLLSEPISSSDFAEIPQLLDPYSSASLTLFASAPGQQGLLQTQRLAAAGPTHQLRQQAIVAVKDIELSTIPGPSAIKSSMTSACLTSSTGFPDLTLELSRAVAAIESQQRLYLPPP